MNSKPKTIGRELVEAVFILCMVAGSAGGVGYWLGQDSNRQILIDERADKIAEIERLQLVHSQALSILASKTTNAAATANTAAVIAGDAAASVAGAAETAQAAAASAAKAAKAAGVPAVTLEQNRKAINRAVDSANSKIAK